MSPITLPLHCAHCRGSITIQMDDYRGDPQPQTWACPYCQRTNEAKFPGRLMWVTQGHDEAMEKH